MTSKIEVAVIVEVDGDKDGEAQNEQACRPECDRPTANAARWVF